MATDSHFARLFRQHRYSDADLSIQLLEPCIDDASVYRDEGEELIAFPVHLAVLSQSPYFESQVNFLEQQQECRGRSRSPVRAAALSRSRSRSSGIIGSKRTRGNEGEQAPLARTARVSTASCHPCSCSCHRPRVVLTVQHREHEAAAVAVIATIYGVKGALSSLQQPELVYAVQYADLLQAEATTAQALQLLKTAATATTGLSVDTLAKLAALPSWPSCLLPLLADIAKGAKGLNSVSNGTSSTGTTNATSKEHQLQLVLVKVLGDLEAVWQQQELSRVLLALPAPAMQLLLSSDHLRVYSEDTVLYTASKWVEARSDSTLLGIAPSQLGALVRAPHLSDFQRTAQAISSASGRSAILHRHRSSLRTLLSLMRLDLDTENLRELIERELPEAAKSWLLGPRHIVSIPPEGVRLSWQLPVTELKAMGQKCYSTQQVQNLYSPTCTPPLFGMDWMICLECVYKATDNGVSILGVASPHRCPKEAVCIFNFGFQVDGGSKKISYDVIPSQPGKGGMCWGWYDFFEVGVLSGGWDDGAWVGAGWPADGNIKVVLSIFGVH